MTADPSPEHEAGVDEGDAFPGSLGSVSGAFVATGTARLVAAGALGGLAGAGATLLFAGGSAPVWAGAGILCGGMTGLLAGPYVTRPGDGLVRGLAIGVVSWVLALGVLALVRSGTMMRRPVAFPLFVRATLGLGAPTGLALGAVAADDPLAPASPHRIAVGILAGLAAGAVFAASAVQDALVSSLSAVAMVGGGVPSPLVFYLVAAAIGGSFAWLFDAEIHSAGSSLLYGLGYGLLWWLLGALTLLPLARSGTVAWTETAAAARLGQLIGHAVFGIALGLLYAALTRLWRGLVVDPDPVAPGTGTATTEMVRASLRGGGASLLGSAVFGAVLWRTGDLTTVARLLGRSGVAAGLALHLGIGTVIGVTYGQLFRYEAPDLGGGVLWGVVYGVVWWVLGPLTLLPLLLDASLAWTADAIKATVPMLVGHVLYGALTGAVFTVLERRHAAWARVVPRIAAEERRRRRRFATAAPSLWLFVLVTTVVVPATLLP